MKRLSEMQNEKTKMILYAPIKILTAYIILTVTLFLIGPIKYKFDNRLDVVFYIGFFLLLSVFCYDQGIKQPFNRKCFVIKQFNYYSFLKFAIIFSLMYQIIHIFESVNAT